MRYHHELVEGKVVEVSQGSITEYDAEALVCPANQNLSMLALPGGIQYAFLKEAGYGVFERAEKIAEGLGGAVPETSAVLTGAGDLAAKHILHSVSLGYNPATGELYCNGDIIAQSVRNILDLAEDTGIASVGIPALGTGVWGVPLEECVKATVSQIAPHLQKSKNVQRVGFVVPGEEDFYKAKDILDKYFR